MAIIDTIFFDVDGTLVDARRDIANAMNYALESMGLPVLPVEKIISYVGTGVSHLISNCLGTDDAKLVEKGIRLYGEYYVAHAADEAFLYPHAVEILDYLKDKRKFILTNRYAAFADILLKALGVRKYFEEVIGGDDEGCLKPSACIIDRVVKTSGIDKSKALIVGDMSYDIMTGNNAGVKTCWVTYGLGNIGEIKDLRPDYIIEDLIELKDIIK